ncbi:MAG: gfo/Idh/MocA family oxidoreductase [Armatimonadia bacterium]|nr:gfo/Idh/MocA family oxidoreductase [Armatimonadia bacterium]
MTPGMTRRGFVGAVGGAAALAASRAAGQPRPANDRIALAHIGTGSIGMHNARIVMELGEAQYVAVCDPDSDRAEAAATEMAEKTGHRPDVYQDFRAVLDRDDVDAVWVSTPDHWHALIAIHACIAGKDVFVEKPISHNVLEGRRMVEAARTHGRIMQAGTQQRSGPHLRDGCAYVRSGALGKVHLCKAWVMGGHPDLGHPPNGQAPEGVDYDLWLGPAPKRPFNPNRFHYEWRWFWDYAGGKCADWGIHLIDMVHWAMDVDAPLAVTSEGGRLVCDDNCDTPDTQVVSWEYPGFICTWEHRYSSYPIEGKGHGIAFHGSEGTLLMDRSGWQVFRTEGEGDAPAMTGSDGQMYVDHAAHFFECVRTRQRPRSDIEIAHRTTTAMHLANIAYRLGRRIEWDGEAEQIIGDAEAAAMLTREYREPWGLPKV